MKQMATASMPSATSTANAFRTEPSSSGVMTLPAESTLSGTPSLSRRSMIGSGNGRKRSYMS